MTEALDTLRIAEAVPSASHLRRVGVRIQGTTDAAPPKETPPADTLLMVVYSGLGFLSGVQRFLAGTDMKYDAKAGLEWARSSGISVADLEQRMRDRAAASVLVYDTNFF
jgi:hypothetical protein